MQDSLSRMLMSRMSNRPSTAIVGNLSVRKKTNEEEEEMTKTEHSRRHSFSETKIARTRPKSSGVRRSIYMTRLNETRNRLRKIRRENHPTMASKKRLNKPKREVFLSRRTKQRNRMANMLSRTNQALVSRTSHSEGSGETLKRHRVAVNKSVRHALRSRGLLDVGGRRKIFDQWITVNSSSELLG